MPASSPPTAPSPSPRDPRLLIATAATALLVLTLLPGAWLAAFHCDEFVVMEHATDFAQGRFDSPGRPGLLWLLLAPLIWLGDPVAIALAHRLTAVLASALTFWGVWRLASLPGENGDGLDEGELGWAGLAAMGLLATSMSWQAHAFEVRTDTYVVPLSLLAAHWLFWRGQSTRRALAIGLAVAAMGLFSQKSVYNGGALGLGWLLLVLAQWRPVGWSQRARTAGIAAGTAIGAVLLWYGLLALLNWESSSFVERQMSAAVKTGFANPPSVSSKLKALGSAVERAPLLYSLGGAGAFSALALGRRNPRQLAVFGLVAGMASTILWHRGFFMYYIASMEPYLAVLAGGFVGGLCAMLHRKLGWKPAALLLVALIAAQGWQVRGWVPRMLVTNMDRQISLMRDVREAFPEDVPYWDAIGSIPGYAETTFFGTGTARGNFRKSQGNKGFIKRARKKRPHFFLRNYMTRERYLKPTERTWHWSHFLPYRPNFSLGGARIRVKPGEHAEHSIELLVTGEYTVWFRGGWTGTASVDGQELRHKQALRLDQGRHLFAADANEGEDGHGQLWLMLGRDRVPQWGRAEDQVDWTLFPMLLRHRYQQYDRPGKPGDLRTPDNDPDIGKHNRKKRLARHRAWHRKQDKKLGTP